MRSTNVYKICTASSLLIGRVLAAVNKDLTYCAVGRPLLSPQIIQFLTGNEPNAIISDACVTYSALDDLNNEIRPVIQEITQKSDYFRYYKLNLFGKECPFWSDADGMCGNRACSVDVIEDEKDVPEMWRAAELGKLAGPKASHPVNEMPKEEPSPLRGELGPDTSESCVFEDDSLDKRDYCVPEDETAESGVYVSLMDNPERFTGYGGKSAHNVWNAVYQENCFIKGMNTLKQNSMPFAFSKPAALGLKNVMDTQKHKINDEQNLVDLQFDNECMEKRVFHKVISGMHASISMHLCWDYLNRSTEQWGPNLQCYIDRLHNHPERIRNIYFNYALVLRAVAKLRNHLQTHTFCAGDALENRATKSKVLALANRAAKPPPIFDETLMFRDTDHNTPSLKEDFRNRFRNVSRLMDCVGCDKCRLWGKVQTQGYGTALKVLFEFDEADTASNPPLRRTEMVALINTLDKLSSSIAAAAKFARMVEEQADHVHGDTLSQNQSIPRVAHVSAEKPALPEVPQPPQPDDVKNSQSNNLARDDDFDQPVKTSTAVDDDGEQPTREQFTLREEFWQEFGIVWDAFVFVLRSWWNLPKNIYTMGLYYIAQAWSSFVGVDNHQTRQHPHPVVIPFRTDL